MGSQVKRLVFLVGGPAFHPVAQQAGAISDWLGPGYSCDLRQGVDAFDALDDCDLFVMMGFHWKGDYYPGLMGDCVYIPPSDAQKKAFTEYVASGRPVLVHHGGICSYEDWPEFKELIGFAWIFGTTNHPPIGQCLVEVLPTGHPVMNGIQDYELHDEKYYDVWVAPGLEPQVHAETEWEGRRLPVIRTAEGGRISGAGKLVYIGSGHDMQTFECPALKQIWRNAVAWLLSE